MPTVSPPPAGQLGLPHEPCSQSCVCQRICVEELALSGRSPIRSLKSTICRLGSSMFSGAASAKPQTIPNTAIKENNRPKSLSLIASSFLFASIITQMPWSVKDFFWINSEKLVDCSWKTGSCEAEVYRIEAAGMFISGWQPRRCQAYGVWQGQGVICRSCNIRVRLEEKLGTFCWDGRYCV